MNTPVQAIKLTFFVATMSIPITEAIQSVKIALRENFLHDQVAVDVVDVLHEPERALAYDVYTTPTLIRESPPPQIKLMGSDLDLSNIAEVITKLLR